MNNLTITVQSEHDGAEQRLRVVAKVDGKPLVDFAYFGLAADLEELQRSLEINGEYFIITCACGVPACAGIRTGIKVLHHPDRVTWVYRTWPDPATQPDLVQQTPSRRPEWVVRGIKLPTKTFVFDRSDYQQAIAHGIKRGKQLVQQLPHQNVSVAPLHNQHLFES